MRARKTSAVNIGAGISFFPISVQYPTTVGLSSMCLAGEQTMAGNRDSPSMDTAQVDETGIRQTHHRSLPCDGALTTFAHASGNQGVSLSGPVPEAQVGAPGQDSKSSADTGVDARPRTVVGQSLAHTGDGDTTAVTAQPARGGTDKTRDSPPGQASSKHKRNPTSPSDTTRELDWPSG